MFCTKSAEFQGHESNTGEEKVSETETERTGGEEDKERETE